MVRSNCKVLIKYYIAPAVSALTNKNSVQKAVGSDPPSARRKPAEHPDICLTRSHE